MLVAHLTNDYDSDYSEYTYGSLTLTDLLDIGLADVAHEHEPHGILALRGGGKDDDSQYQLARFSGARGPKFADWLKDWREFASAKFNRDDECSWLSVTNGTDQGAVGAAPFPETPS